MHPLGGLGDKRVRLASLFGDTAELVESSAIVKEEYRGARVAPVTFFTSSSRTSAISESEVSETRWALNSFRRVISTSLASACDSRSRNRAALGPHRRRRHEENDQENPVLGVGYHERPIRLQEEVVPSKKRQQGSQQSRPCAAESRDQPHDQHVQERPLPLGEIVSPQIEQGRGDQDTADRENVTIPIQQITHRAHDVSPLNVEVSILQLKSYTSCTEL